MKINSIFAIIIGIIWAIPSYWFAISVLTTWQAPEWALAIFGPAYSFSIPSFLFAIGMAVGIIAAPSLIVLGIMMRKD